MHCKERQPFLMPSIGRVARKRFLSISKGLVKASRPRELHGPPHRILPDTSCWNSEEVACRVDCDWYQKRRCWSGAKRAPGLLETSFTAWVWSSLKSVA